LKLKKIEKSPEDIKRSTRRSFILAGVFILLVPLTFFLIQKAPENSGTSAVFRYSFMANEKLWSMLSSGHRLSVKKTPPIGQPPRVNGLIGIRTKTSAKDYRVTIEQEGRKMELPLSSFYLIPKKSHSTDFRCIEGWSEERQYAGAVFSEWMESQNLGKKSDGSYYQYVGFETPDGEYYVSIDMESMLHSQTVLAWELNGKGLSLNNGFPLRLIIPIKYGIKSLKRIGKIFFSDQRPPDYWAERGYDWYSGL
jgi:hypothetical protein